jgi:hypothetical protein
MPSIDSAYIIKELIRSNGCYDDDPQVYSVHSYMNDWGGQTYHVSYSEDQEIALWSSPYCHEIRLLWSVKLPLHERVTKYGEELLKSNVR